MYQDFPFSIVDVAYLLNLHIRHKNAVSLDVDCPFCGEKKGKLNLNTKKNVFKCNRCGESGGMLSLYGKIYGVDNQTACNEIKDALGRNEQAPAYQVRKREIIPKEPEIENAPPAPDAVRHKTYSMFFSMLVLADTHRQNLLKRGFTEQQIEENGYKSTPVFGYKNLTKKLLAAGCTVEGVPGFYQDKDGEWTIHFSNKSSGFLVPIRNMDGLIVGAQIRLDHPYDGRKYIWLSSTNYHKGTSSGSPIHLAGRPGEKTIFVTEGPLKGDLAHALSGRTFGCVPGANQYANLPPFLQAMKLMGTEAVYEAYDMDKLLKTACRGDYNEKCVHCENYRKDWKQQVIPCEKKIIKRQNIQRGCRRLTQICRETELSVKTLTWDMDSDGDWAENVKGVDDYLYDLEQKKAIVNLGRGWYNIKKALSDHMGHGKEKGMSTLEKTIDLLNTLPENQIEAIYSFVQFLSSQQTKEMPGGGKPLDDILQNIIGAIPDTGKTLEEYREERIKERYETVN